jgi:hypothetical protein
MAAALRARPGQSLMQLPLQLPMGSLVVLQLTMAKGLAGSSCK